MSHDAETDDGTVLRSEAWAATWSEADGFVMVIPDLPDRAQAPDEGMALLAALMRLENDHSFREECVAWIKNQSKS